LTDPRIELDLARSPTVQNCQLFPQTRIAYCRRVGKQRKTSAPVVNSESDDRDQVNVLSSSRKLAFVIAVILLFGLGTVTETANAVAPQLFTTAKQATPSADAHVAQNFPAKNYGSSGV